jgi:CHASE3 domain sensor protein
MFKTGLALGFAAGYVFGSKAGQERYQQILDAARSFTSNPGVQRFTNEVNKTVSLGRERAAGAASKTVERVGDQLADKTSKASDRVASPSGQSGASNGQETT